MLMNRLYLTQSKGHYFFICVLDWEFLRCDGEAKVPNIFKKTFYLGLGSRTQINHPPKINAGDTIHVIGNML